MSCPSWQWHRTGSRWSPVRTLPVAPLWCDLGFVPNSRGNKAAANLRPWNNTHSFQSSDHLGLPSWDLGQGWGGRRRGRGIALLDPSQQQPQIGPQSSNLSIFPIQNVNLKTSIHSWLPLCFSIEILAAITVIWKSLKWSLFVTFLMGIMSSQRICEEIGTSFTIWTRKLWFPFLWVFQMEIVRKNYFFAGLKQDYRNMRGQGCKNRTHVARLTATPLNHLLHFTYIGLEIVSLLTILSQCTLRCSSTSEKWQWELEI